MKKFEISGLKPVFMMALAAVLMCCGTYGLSAQDMSAQKNRKADLEREIRVLDQQLSGINSKSRNALSELSIVNRKIAVRKELIADREKQIADINGQIRGKERKLKSLQENLDTLYNHYTRLVRSAYKNRDIKVWYMYILASDNVGQAFRRYSYFKNLSSQMKEQAEEIRSMQMELQEQKSALQKMKAEENEERNKLAEELSGLGDEQKKADNVLSSLKRDKRKYEREIAARKRQVAALNREIERIISGAIKESGSSSSLKAKAPVDYALAEEFHKNKGKLPWPATGSVIEHYGVRYHPLYKNLKLPSNDGVTIALDSGTAVKAVFDGVVKQIAVMPGYNKCILVQHGNYFSLYCKMGDCTVKAGDKVKTGDILGTVDTMNGETQLHFQIWKGQSTQNPESWLRPM